MGAAEGDRARHQVRGTWALSLRGAGRTVLASGEFEVLRQISGEAFSGIEEEGVLPDVDPRTPAAAGEKATEGGGLGEGDRASQVGQTGRAALRLCNVVAQSPSDAERGLQAGGREGTDGAGDRTVGDRLLQAVPKPDAGHWEGE